MIEREILQALKNNEPFRGLPNVRAANVVAQPRANQGEFDAKFDLQFGETKVEVYVEVKSTYTPKQVEQIAPWLSRMKAIKSGTGFALLCPALSPESQRLCLEKNVDFIDLAGNMFVNVPGKLLLQRVGMKRKREPSPSFYRNPFSGRASRILRVLLQAPWAWTTRDGRHVEVVDVNRAMERIPKAWTLSEITKELATETRRAGRAGVSFEVSFSLASRVLRSLEEELLVIRRPTPFYTADWEAEYAQELLVIRRPTPIDPDQAVPARSLEGESLVARRNPILVPEPKRLLSKWAQEYKDRYRWYLRRSFKIPNPFGPDLKAVRNALDGLLKPGCYAFTGAAAASVTAPFVDVDPIDLYISDEAAAEDLRAAVSGTSVGPDLRVIYPFDPGVFMYSSLSEGIPLVSDIQTYLDLFARGGRDLKQADYLLKNRIEPNWGSK